MNNALRVAPATAPVPGARWLVLALALLHVALYPFAALVVDSGRDLANGLAIANGVAWPAYGPMLFGTWHLGPAWYLLLALPLGIGGSVGATAVFVGVLAALKIPLAYRLGARLGDGRLALFCAAFAALPGWQVVGALVLSHTALVETLVYATLLCCVVAVQARRVGVAVFAALLLALALHAHPTALIVAPAMAWAVWRSTSRPVLAALAAALVFVLPFAPMLVAEAAAGWPQLAGTGRYLGGGGFASRLLRVPAVAWGAGWDAGAFVRVFLLDRVPVVAWFWQGVWVLGWLGALVGAGIGLRDGRRAAAWALCAWFAAVVFVCLLRDHTPVWMVYALAPLQVLAWAFGWQVLSARLMRGRAVAVAMAGIALVLSVGLLVDRVAVSTSGLQALPGAAIGDVANPPLPEPASRAWLTAVGHDRVARRLCASTEPVSLHGDLAVALDLGENVGVALHCRAALAPRLGGRDGTMHRVGVPEAVATRFGLAGEHIAGFVLMTPARVLFPDSARIAQTDVAYRADTLAALAPRGLVDERLDVTCATGELLAITNRLPDLNPLQAGVRDAAAPRTPLLAHLATQYFACDGAPLVVELRTLDPASIDIFVLPRG